jgi:hypothetical protein
MPFEFNDRRNDNPPAPIADYNSKKDSHPRPQPGWIQLGKGAPMTRADADHFETMEHYGGKVGSANNGKYSEKNAAADIAYQDSWIGKGRHASDQARRAGAKITEPQYKTPGGLVLDAVKKKK